MPTSRPHCDITPGATLTAAATFLRTLPEPWAPQPGTAWALAPALRDTARARGWTLGPDLRDLLTSWPDGIRSHEAVLAARIRRLPTRTRAAAPSTATARSTDTSTSRCARCGRAGSVVHASSRWPRPVCIRCATAAAGPPAADPAAHAAAARAALRYGRRISSP
ncbi:hypothetical protein ACIQK6_13620 [Streptomyces sp. NPDC091682]|uniref:hypothetical protein n=1 Tax=Streptomyces sp. NPDC091682 TaxID=3366005 RepID=UPI0037F70509